MEGIRKAVFIDRDDTLCIDVPYCRDPKDLRLFPGAGEAVKKLNDAGFIIVIITNQSGIARGYLTEEDLAQIHEKMKKDLEKVGARVDGIYYCPHHPNDKCDCRKPSPFMVQKAAQDLGLSLERSYVVGDRLMDVQLARNANSKAILVKPPHPLEEFKEAAKNADHVSINLTDAVDWILAQQNK